MGSQVCCVDVVFIVIVVVGIVIVIHLCLFREMIAKEYPDALLILMETKNMWETRETFGWTYAKVMWNGWGRLSVEGALTILSGRYLLVFYFFLHFH